MVLESRQDRGVLVTIRDEDALDARQIKSYYKTLLDSGQRIDEIYLRHDGNGLFQVTEAGTERARMSMNKRYIDKDGEPASGD